MLPLPVQGAQPYQPLQRVALRKNAEHLVQNRFYQPTYPARVGAVGAGAQQHIQNRVWPQFLEGLPAQFRLQWQLATLALPLKAVGQLQVNLPVVAAVWHRIEQRLAELGLITYRHHAEYQVVMAADR